MRPRPSLWQVLAYFFRRQAQGQGSGRLALWLIVALALPAAPGAVLAEDFTIGYLQLKKDVRYGKKRLYARYLGQALGRPYAGAKMALSETKFHGAKLGLSFKLERVRAEDGAELAAAVDELLNQGVHFFVLDLPAEQSAELAAASRDKPLLLFNISARDDALRQQQCQPNLLHVIPNHAMLTDALTQYLLAKKWNRILLLHGENPEDLRMTAAVERSANRYQADIVAKKPFILSNDPRQRDRNNVALLTAGESAYDVVLVADTDGEFARAVPYQTVKPTPVVGSEGLAAVAWHWSWERHGAPQLENRFEDEAGRPMSPFDWAAWLAVKAVAEAVQRTESAEFAVLAEYLKSQDVILDGFKGNRLNFRPWDNQLRQPILLVTHNWVVERAPLKGFLHHANNMDTLGFDERESRCNFDG